LILDSSVSKILKILKEVMTMIKIFKDFIKEEKGQTLVEWILILALILVIIIATIRTIGEKGNDKANKIKQELERP
jgi:Flp pilus assembly pilin Flp